MWDKAQPRTQPRAGSHAVPSPPAGLKRPKEGVVSRTWSRKGLGGGHPPEPGLRLSWPAGSLREGGVEISDLV